MVAMVVITIYRSSQCVHLTSISVASIMLYSIQHNGYILYPLISLHRHKKHRHTHSHTQTHRRTHTHTHTCTHTDTQTHTHTQTHTCTQMNTPGYITRKVPTVDDVCLET